MKRYNSLNNLNQKIVQCKKCARLSIYIKRVAEEKVKRYLNEDYWGRPLTGYGDINAKVLIIGLAPAAHGGNRTGRMFTGDSSGDWLAKVLYENGFATKPTSQYKNDGFKLINTYITASVRCAPPQNKPSREEMDNCAVYLQEELRLLKNVQVIICLGKIAFDSCSKILGIKGTKFSHGNLLHCGKWTVLCTYHPSRQNTQTGRLSWKQWSDIFIKVKRILNETI